MALYAMLVSGMTLTSCSSDDADSLALGQVAGQDLLKGITTKMDGGIYEIPISANTDWNASVNYISGNNWVDVVGGKKEKELIVSVDPNYTGVGRSAKLIVKAGSEVKEILITQNFNDAVSNSDVAFLGIAETKGLGVGYDLASCETRSPIINMKAVGKLLDIDDVEYEDLFIANKKAEIKADGEKVDSMETKRDALDVSLDFNITYGLFKLNIGGAYHGRENKNVTMTQYHVAAQYPALEASTSCNGAYVSYKEALAHPEDLTSENKYKKLLLTKGFAAMRDDVNTAAAAANYDAKNASVKNAINAMVNEYGSMVVSKSVLGGAVDLKFHIDSIYTSDTLSVDTAHVKVAVQSGLLNLNAGVQVDYKKTAVEILQHGTYDYYIRGGAQNEMVNIGDKLVNGTYTDVQNAVNAWVKSINATDGDDNSADVVKVNLMPIWVFFDAPVKELVRDFVLEKYKDSELLNPWRVN